MLKEILNRPYYFQENIWYRWGEVLFITVFVFLFLSIFQPFGLSDYDGNKLALFFSYASINFVVTAFFNVLIPVVLPKWFRSEYWTTGKEIGFLFLMLFSIGIANTVFSAWKNFFDTFWIGFLYFEFYTFTVGFFPVICLVFLTEKIQNKKHIALSNTLVKQNISTPNIAPSSPTLSITASNDKVALEIAPEKIYYFQSEANYIEVIYQTATSFDRCLIRNTLVAMETQLKDYKDFFRCHKSYMVNLRQVQRVSGNAQGLKLHFEDLEKTIPVSRKYNSMLKKRFQD